MKIKDLDPIITSELRITFDDDPHTGTVDIIIPVAEELTEILGEKILNMDIRLMEAQGNAIAVSTATR